MNSLYLVNNYKEDGKVKKLDISEDGYSKEVSKLFDICMEKLKNLHINKAVMALLMPMPLFQMRVYETYCLQYYMIKIKRCFWTVLKNHKS